MNEHLNSFYQKAREHNDIANDLFRRYDIKKGLRNEDGTGVRVGLTKIADVVGYKYVEEVKTDDIGRLYYRGIELRDIIHGRNYETICGYEETCFLLLFGYLPKEEELKEFCAYLRTHYELPDDFLESKFLHMPGKNLMNRLQQAVLALYDYDDAPDNISVENTLEQGLNILAKLPSIICYAYQSKMHRYNKESLVIHPAQEHLSIAENILYMLRKDHAFSTLEAKLLDMMLIVHADHGGGNNSTFTNVVISSTGTDFYSSMVGAIGSMKGPRHGGANLKVSGMMKAVIEEIGYCENDIEIKALIYRILHKQFYDYSGLVYGMGHAIYTLSDPRSEVLQEYIEKLAEKKGRVKEYEFYQRFEQCAKEVILDVKGVNVSSNVDFYSGFVYSMMGIPEDLFTPLFVMARTVGWLAHNIENKEYDGRIMRPATKYVG
ncbi:citrate synthase, partial [[Clostridium] innocuum]|nr:citrate synthase [[Clostridium] innocuum]